VDIEGDRDGGGEELAANDLDERGGLGFEAATSVPTKPRHPRPEAVAAEQERNGPDGVDRGVSHEVDALGIAASAVDEAGGVDDRQRHDPNFIEQTCEGTIPHRMRGEDLEPRDDRLRAYALEAMNPADLSGGMRKRVGLARTIALRPEVLLYDEPTTGLDPINTERINHLIKGLKSSIDVTSIVVTHDMKSAFSVSDRMAMVHSGAIVLCGTPSQFQESRDPRVHDFINGIAPVNEDVETLLKA
jgi:hypothetical protein